MKDFFQFNDDVVSVLCRFFFFAEHSILCADLRRICRRMTGLPIVFARR